MKKLLSSKRFSITLGFIWFWVFFCLWLIISNTLFTAFNFNVNWILTVFLLAMVVNIVIPILIKNEKNLRIMHFYFVILI